MERTITAPSPNHHRTTTRHSGEWSSYGQWGGGFLTIITVPSLCYHCTVTITAPGGFCEETELGEGLSTKKVWSSESWSVDDM